MSYSTTDALRLAAKHYMYTKQREFIEDKSKSEIVHHLRDAYSQAKAVVGPDEVQHCQTWATVLEDLLDA